MRTIFSRIALTIVFGCCCNVISAVDSPYYHVLLESDVNGSGGDELFLASYDSLQGFIDGILASGTFSQVNISSEFSVGGITYDGLQYHLLLETDDNAGAGKEVFLASYDSLQDFFDGTLASGTFSQINISSPFSAGGFTYDGLQYHLLLETDDNAGAGKEVFLASYDSLQDFVDGTLASGTFSQLNISSPFSAGGFDFDGNQYHVLLESDSNSGGGDEVFLASYNSLQDFFDGSLAAGTFSQLNISSPYSAGGFFSEPTVSLPDSVTTTRGDYVSGDEASLAEGDNVDFSIRRRGTDTLSRTEFEVVGMSRTANPASFEVTLEGAVFARNPVVQTIELWDYIAGTWELVDSRNATNLVDSTATVSATGDLSRFVDQTTFLVEARIRFQSTNPRQRFSSNTDQFIWTIER